MKKKNILSLVLALTLVAALAVGATLAYFTDNDTTKNTFTMGKVDINIDESKDKGATWQETGLDYQNVLPGAKVDKKARVTVESGSADCYLMVTAKLTIPSDTKLNPNDIQLLNTALYNAIDKTLWTVTEKQDANGEKVFQCVYNGTDGDHIAHATNQLILFEQIEIPGEEFKNNTANQQFGIELKAYAIQSENVNGGVYDDSIWASVYTDTPTFETYPLPAEEPQK